MFRIKKRIGKKILPVLQEILDNKLYVPNYAARWEFTTLIRTEAMSCHATPIEDLAIGLLYFKDQPIAWIFYRYNVVWSFTKPEFRKLGINNFLLRSFKNPFVKETAFAHPHPKWDGKFMS